MAPFSSSNTGNRDRDARLQRHCLVLGLAVGAAGAVWILLGWRRPQFALCYHVPLAVVTACWAAALILATSGRRRWLDAAAALLALGLVTGRIQLDWPLSGHAVLGALVAVRAPWRWLRIAAVAVVLQAAITKWWLDLGPLTVLSGAAAGWALGWMSARLHSSDDLARDAG